MIIIALLVGGVLKGNEIYVNAQVTGTIVQTQSYEAATLMFVDSYNALPGDMPDASIKLPNCSSICDPYGPTAGNYIIGSPSWANNWDSQELENIALPAASEEAEVALFWLHLLKAGYIIGVSDGTMTGARTAWGATNPAAKLGGEFIVGYADGTPTPGQPYMGSIGP